MQELLSSLHVGTGCFHTKGLNLLVGNEPAYLWVAWAALALRASGANNMLIGCTLVVALGKDAFALPNNPSTLPQCSDPED